jgi:phosphoglycerate kinase
MSEKLSIRDLDVRNKRVLIRVDFNVPFENGEISDDTRIRASLPTIRYVFDHGGIPILMSHLGRPKGKKDPLLSLKPCAERLSKLLERPVLMGQDCCGLEIERICHSLKHGDILMLENLRFHPGEEKPADEPSFASSLADLGDFYVDDAFSCSHREHASITAITTFFPGKSAAGFLMEKEIAYLDRTIKNPERPFYAILGGAKISTKFKVIEALLQKADLLLIGGAMAYTFFKAENIPIGNSLVENDFLPVARELMDVGVQSRCRILLPSDIVAVRAISSPSERVVVPIPEGIPEGFEGVDIGPETIKKYKNALQSAATVFWNGPLGVFETPPFDQGTNEIAHCMASLSANTIVGGGDTIAALDRAGEGKNMSHLSTGGGASLEYIELGNLPGIEALSDVVA